jgi:hypothetical protein
MPFRTVFIVASLLAVLVAGCGGSSSPERTGAAVGAPAASGVDGLLKTTFANLGKIQSGNLDLKLDITPQDSRVEPVSAHISGPFQSGAGGQMPQFSLSAELQSGAKSITGGATFTGRKGFLSLQGNAYALDDALMQRLRTAYGQAQQQGRQRQGLVLSTLGVDFSKWLKSARNEGTATVGDVPTTKISGDANVAQVIDDLEKVAARARALNLPGASGAVPPQLTPQQKQQEIDAIKSLSVDVYTGTQDKILRRLVVSAVLSDMGTQSKIGLDLTFTDLGKPQAIAAPKHPRPFSELKRAIAAAGLGDTLGLGGSSAGVNNVDKYAQCIAQANGDPKKGRECAALLSG